MDSFHANIDPLDDAIASDKEVFETPRRQVRHAKLMGNRQSETLKRAQCHSSRSFLAHLAPWRFKFFPFVLSPNSFMPQSLLNNPLSCGGSVPAPITAKDHEVWCDAVKSHTSQLRLSPRTFTTLRISRIHGERDSDSQSATFLRITPPQGWTTRHALPQDHQGPLPRI